ncbi:MAG: ABC transporter ATP-binding protein [Bacteroidia bacterium]|nr:ABC transporter ATP-binding protein [Bacteroidia bacterium]
MLRLVNINKKIGSFSLNDIGFSVNKGDYFILVGQSGAGKTMLLEMITGLLQPDSGQIFLKEKEINNTPIQNRNIGLVYQNQTLFPHMTVFENIAYPLKSKKHKKADISSCVKQLACDTEISHLLNRNITGLSGGEARRVTIARTLATNPDILLLDEPLAFLDIQLRRGLSSLLRKINQNGHTIIHVTHDYEEAIALANKIAILEKGIIIQTGSPHEVFQNPKSEFVANFIGIKNFFKGNLYPSEPNSNLKIVVTSGVKIYALSDEDINSEGYISIPGEIITISENKLSSSAINNFQGKIKDVFHIKLGLEIIIDIGVEISAQITRRSFETLQLNIGRDVWISFKASSVTFIKTLT